jgi:hypothetical protein
MTPLVPSSRQRGRFLSYAAKLLSDMRGTSTTEFLVLFVVICVLSLIGWRYMGVVIVRIISGD